MTLFCSFNNDVMHADPVGFPRLVFSTYIKCIELFVTFFILSYHIHQKIMKNVNISTKI